MINERGYFEPRLLAFSTRSRAIYLIASPGGVYTEWFICRGCDTAIKFDRLGDVAPCENIVLFGDALTDFAMILVGEYKGRWEHGVDLRVKYGARFCTVPNPSGNSSATTKQGAINKAKEFSAWWFKDKKRTDLASRVLRRIIPDIYCIQMSLF